MSVSEDWQRQWMQTERDLAELTPQFDSFHDLSKEERASKEVQSQLRKLREACVAVGNRRITLCIELQKRKLDHDKTPL